MSKFIEIDVYVDIISGDGSSHSKLESVILNIDYITRFTKFGNFIWMADGTRYSTSKEGMKQLELLTTNNN